MVEINLQEIRSLFSVKGVMRDQHLSDSVSVKELVEEMNKVVFCLDVRRQRREPELPIKPWLVWHHKRRHDGWVSWLIVELIVSPGPCPLVNRVIVRPLYNQFWSPAPHSCHLPEQSVGISYMQGGSVSMSPLSKGVIEMRYLLWVYLDPPEECIVLRDQNSVPKGEH